MVICPPAVFLSDLAKIKGGQIALGAQDAFWERDGAYTGMLSPTMLRNAGADYLILGHSERRRLGDGDGEINRKVALALKHRLKVILCVGEERRDPDGFYLQTIRTQLEAGLAGVPKKQLNELIVAYEPVWAIGEAARASDTPRDFLEQQIYIRKVMAGLAGKELALKLPVLYGGSVDGGNAYGFLTEGGPPSALGGVGLLVGRASLEPREFIKILQAAHDAAHH